MAKIQLLAAYVAAYENLHGEPSADLRYLLAEVSRRRPDLLERSLFAERRRSTSQMEMILRNVLAEVDGMVEIGLFPDDFDPPYLGNIRFNHSTGRLHLGSSHRSVLIFTD